MEAITKTASVVIIKNDTRSEVKNNIGRDVKINIGSDFKITSVAMTKSTS